VGVSLVASRQFCLTSGETTEFAVWIFLPRLIPLAVAAIAIHIHRTRCGDYGFYSPKDRLAKFQVGRSQSLPASG
jgi:hypothetical protein